MIRFACGTCKERLVVPAHHAGRRGKCPNCGTVNRVPRTSEFAGPEGATITTAPTLQPAQALPRRASEPTRAEATPLPPLNPLGSADSPARLVEVDLLDDAGMPVWMKLLIVAGILGLLVLGVWVVFYLLIWSHLKLTG